MRDTTSLNDSASSSGHDQMLMTESHSCPEIIIENKEQSAWRDIKCFNDLKEMLDFEKVAGYSITLYQDEIFDLLNILSTCENDGQISLEKVH